MANFLSPTTLRKMAVLFEEGHSIRSVASSLGVSREAARKYAKQLQPDKCPCGKPARHKGWCGSRYLKSSVHKELLAKVHADYVEPPRPSKPPRLNGISTEYPYCIGVPGEGNALLMSVNAAVSKRLPDDTRADVCQDILLSILEGDVRIEELTKAVRPAVQKRNAMFSMFHRSLDAPVAYDESGAPLTLVDILPSDYEPILGKRSVRRGL